MEKEEKIVLVLLAMLLCSISIAYVTFFTGDGGDIAEFSMQSNVGEKVVLEGSVLSKRMTNTGGHLLMTVDSSAGPVKVFVPSKNGAQDMADILEKKDVIRVVGTVDMYQREKEVVVHNKDDVSIVKGA